MKALQMRTAPIRSTSMVCAHSRSVSSRKSPLAPRMPAEWTRIWAPPKSSFTLWARSRTSSSLVMSAGRPSTPYPSTARSRTCAMARSNPSSPKSVNTRWTPSSARAKAVANPIPESAPVTTAVLPLIPRSIVSILSIPFKGGIAVHPTIHKNCRSIDVFRFIRGQPTGHLRNILGIPDPAVGNEFEHFPDFLPTVPFLLVYGRLYGPGGDAVAPDLSVGIALADALHQHGQGPLGCGIIRMARPGDLLVHRTDVYDLSQGLGYLGPGAPVQEYPDGRPGAKKLSGEVHIEYPLP